MSKSILNLINEVAADPKTKHLISVLPLMCGTGKSTAISQKIREVIKADNDEGLLVITDKADRLDEYMNPQHDGELCRYLQQHRSKVVKLCTGFFRDGYARMKNCPVLLTTTQHYTRLDAEGIRDLLTWKHHGETAKRLLVLVDEYPMLAVQATITTQMMHEVAGVISMLNDTVSFDDKQWCIQQWNAVLDKVQGAVNQYRAMNPSTAAITYHLYKNDSGCMTDDDDRFMKILNKAAADQEDDTLEKMMKNVLAVKRMMTYWGLYYGQHNDAMHSSRDQFQVVLSNFDHYRKCHSKVIVLDGTGNLFPTYDIKEVDMRDVSEFDRPLNHLYIHYHRINTNTEKMTHTGTEMKIREVVVPKIKEVSVPHQPTVFLRMDKEHADAKPEAEYKKIFGNDRVAHFGDIIGSNAYRGCECICQVGMNRYPPYFYLALYLYADQFQGDNVVKKLKAISNEQERYDTLKTWYTGHKADIDNLMYKALMTDTEQNLFRGCIRNNDNTKDYHYHLFFDRLDGIIDLIKERFVEHGAQYNYEGRLLIEGEQPTLKEQVLYWLEKRYEQRNTEPFSRHDVVVGAGLKSDEQFKQLLKDNSDLKATFEAMVKQRRPIILYQIAF